jgi:hypothetical protein
MIANACRSTAGLIHVNQADDGRSRQPHELFWRLLDLPLLS